jgi:hypothetical protein
MISRFFGLHTVTWKQGYGNKTIHLVVMNNIFMNYQIGLRYDLKGSIAGRTRLEEGQLHTDPKLDKKTALKDNDFNLHIKEIEIIDDSKMR